MPKSNIIYLDYAASSLPNPSGIHGLALKARSKLESARETVSKILCARPREVLFTGSGTESNNLAIQGTVLAWHEKFLPHIVTTNIEHPSVLETCKMLERRKLAELTIVEVDSNGLVDPKKISRALRKTTLLVSVMYANNEIGTIQPIAEIAKVIRHYKKSTQKSFLVFHTDAVQAAHYLNLNVQKLGVDLMSLSGSKIADTSGIGALYVRKGTSISPILGGGDQEFGLRPGTPNLAGILNFARALKTVQASKEKETKRLSALRDYFFKELCGLPRNVFTGVVVLNGDMKNRLPNNLNVTFAKIPSDLLVIELSARGIMLSSKSACKSSQSGGSYVIQALRSGADPEIGGVRFSLGTETTRNDIARTVRALSLILQKLKMWYH